MYKEQDSPARRAHLRKLYTIQSAKKNGAREHENLRSDFLIEYGSESGAPDAHDFENLADFHVANQVMDLNMIFRKIVSKTDTRLIDYDSVIKVNK